MYLKALMLMVPELLSQASNHAQRHKSKWESDVVRTDIFKLHSLIVDDYRSYIQIFININDPEIREVVENDLSQGKLWPEPLIQFNPAFETYGEVPELIN